MITDQQLVINNFEEKSQVFTHVVNGEFISEEDFAIANTEVPTDTFNIFLPKSTIIKNADKIRHGIGNFTTKGYPFSTWIDAQLLNDAWKELMQEYDLIEAERNVMMKLENTLHIEVNQFHQINITPVKSNEELMKYTEVFMSLFEGSPEKEALEIYFNKFSQVKLNANVQMFIGCIGDMPVATGLLIESEDSYGIYDVMTKETYRGKGFGSEMFQFLLNQTKDKQKPVVLQASDDGINIYKRFGFKEVGEMVVFE